MQMRIYALAVLLMGGALAAQPRPFTVSSTPTVVIGNNEADVAATLASVVGATRLPDGRILVADPGKENLKLFSAQGKLIKASGRKGSGPGEINYLARFYRCGAEVFTEDIENGDRVSVFSLEGAFKRSFKFGSPQKQPPYTSACNAAQQFVHHGWGDRRKMTAGAFRTLVSFWLSPANEDLGPSLGEHPGSERWAHVVDKQIVGSGPLPFGKQPVIAVGTQRVYVGSADRFEIMVFDLAGKRLANIIDQTAPVPINKADIDAELARRTADQNQAGRESITREFAAVKFPEFMPAYQRFVVDALDNLWVQDYRRSGRETLRWSVFAPDGKALGRAMLPANLDVFEIGRDYILGRYLDPEESIPQVRLYQLTR